MAALASATSSLDREFSRLYVRYFGFVWRVVRRYGVAPSDLDDVVQDVFMVVYRRLPDFERRSRVETWLVGIIRKVAWRYRRGCERARRKHHDIRAVASPEHEFCTERGAAMDRLERFIAGLPRAQREVFVLSELGGMRGPEIAQATGTKLNTVYAHIRRTRGRFVHWCEEQGSQLPSRVGPETPDAASSPQETKRRIWTLLIGRLGSEGAPAGTGVAASSLVADAKVLLIMVAIGGLGVAIARPVIEPPPPTVVRAAPQIDRAAASIPRAVEPPQPRPSPSVTEAPSPRPATPVVSPPHRKRRASARPVTTPRDSSAPPSALSLSEERRLIAAARTRVGATPREALALLAEHERRFASGILAVERRRLVVRAWCTLRQPHQAREAATTAPDPISLLQRECPMAIDKEMASSGDSPVAGLPVSATGRRP